MGEFESAMQDAQGESLAKKPGIKEAYRLIDNYGRKLRRWNSTQSRAKNGILLWNLKKSVLQQSRTWNDSPTKWELRRAVDLYPDSTIEEKIENGTGDSDSSFYNYGKAIDSQRQKVEAKANRLRNYVLYGDESIQKAANAKSYSENPFFKAMRDLDYKNQLRVACRITEDLYQSRIGKQLLGDLLFYPPYRFIDFFDDPAKRLPDFSVDLPSQKETLIKPLAESYLKKKNGSTTGQLKRQTNTVVLKLSTLATRMLPGVTQMVSHAPNDADTRKAAQRAIGTILYPLFDSPKLWDDSNLSVPAADVLPKLRTGSLSWGDVTSLGGAFVGKIEGGIGILEDTEGWKNLDSASTWALRLKGVLASVGGVTHAIESFDKIQNDNYQAADMAASAVTLYKTAVDTNTAQYLIKTGKLAAESARRKITEMLGVIGDAIDAVQYFQSSWSNYARGDLSVSAGYGIAGLGAVTSFIAGTLLALTSLSGVGLVAAALVGIAIQITGLSIATFTQDSWLLRWFRQSMWGSNYPKNPENAVVPTTPGNMAYRYVPETPVDEAFSRMTGAFYGQTTDVSLSDVNFSSNTAPPYVEFTFDQFVTNSATDVVVTPVVNQGDGQYQHGDVQHVVHFANKSAITNADVNVQTHVPSGNLNSPATAELRFTQDTSVSSSSIEDLVGIPQSTFDDRGGHYVEVGIVPGELKGELAKQTGTWMQKPGSSSASPSDLPYDTLPIMTRTQVEL
jgi:hypothetical protein